MWHRQERRTQSRLAGDRPLASYGCCIALSAGPLPGLRRRPRPPRLGVEVRGQVPQDVLVQMPQQLPPNWRGLPLQKLVDGLRLRDVAHLQCRLHLDLLYNLITLFDRLD